MPLYQYRCTKCGHDFELLTTIDKRNEACCPKCGEKAEQQWKGKGAFGPMKYTGEN
ncbi:MAG: zinc ribbon domain-containing protein, partial [Clostridia bacterium]|nr:zinc ribbon domain-containing protein [Clostridia bacterium]